MALIDNKINEYLTEKTWTFAEIQDIERTVTNISDSIYETMKPKDKLDLVWDTIVNNADGEEFSRIFIKQVKYQIKAIVAEGIKNHLQSAVITFPKESDADEKPKQNK